MITLQLRGETERPTPNTQMQKRLDHVGALSSHVDVNMKVLRKPHINV